MTLRDRLHAQRHGGVGHPGADGSQTDDTQRLAAQLRTHKLFFALLHILGNGGAALQALRPLHGVHHIAAAGHQSAHRQFGHRIGIGAGRVKDDDALLGAAVNGNVVGSCACAGNGQQAVRQGCLQHIGAAHQNAVGVVHVVVNLELVGGQFGQTDRGNGVERFDRIHRCSSLSYFVCASAVFQLLALRNFSIKTTSSSMALAGMAL